MAEQTVPSPNGPQGSGDWEVTRAPERHVRPPVDIYETPDALMLIADIAGEEGRLVGPAVSEMPRPTSASTLLRPRRASEFILAASAKPK